MRAIERYVRHIDPGAGPRSLDGLCLAVLAACDRPRDAVELAARLGRPLRQVRRAMAELERLDLLVRKDVADNWVDPRCFALLEEALARAVGPMAGAVLGEAAAGIVRDACPVEEFLALAGRLRRTIPSPERTVRFVREVERMMKTMETGRRRGPGGTPAVRSPVQQERGR